MKKDVEVNGYQNTEINYFLKLLLKRMFIAKYVSKIRKIMKVKLY